MMTATNPLLKPKRFSFTVPPAYIGGRILILTEAELQTLARCLIGLEDAPQDLFDWAWDVTHPPALPSQQPQPPLSIPNPHQPHRFDMGGGSGIPDRPCCLCGEPDRHPIHIIDIPLSTIPPTP
jgi:hypothetical protein